MYRPGTKNQPLFKSVLYGTRYAAKLTHRCAEVAACSLGRWLFAQSRHKPYFDTSLLGFWDALELMLIRIVLTSIGMGLSVLIVFLMIAKGIPFLLTGSF